MRRLVFVYGTLMRGHPNHALLRGQEYLGPHTTEPVFTMLHMRGYPGLRPGGQTAVRGEVYRVGPAALRRLDRLEDCPRLFVRTEMDSPFGSAWVYLLARAPRRRRIVRDGVWPGPGRPG